MRLARLFANGACLALAAGAIGCTPEAKGQLMLAVQTDMSLPKDIDAIRIEVLNEGVPKFRKDYERLGTFDGEIRLPGTLALVAPEKPDSAITITVSARVGGAMGKVRVVRQVVTTVPTDRVASLHVPLRFVCDGSGEDENGEAVSTCPDGQTCVAGMCEDRTIDSSTLPDYEEDDVFAGGSCFDPIVCWSFPITTDVDKSDCTIAAPDSDTGGFNVALALEGDGICGPAGCFVTLDANSPEGWRVREDGRIGLPPAVCTMLDEGRVVSIVTTPVTDRCPQKKLSLPTCGPWSSASLNSGTYEGPVAVAGAQLRPVSFALAGNRIYFSNSASEETEGALKAANYDGGQIETIWQGGLAEPRDLLAVGNRVFFTASSGTLGEGGVFRFEPGKVTQLQSGLATPEGIAVTGNRIYWADFQSGDVFEAVDGQIDERRVLTSLPGTYPYRLVADPDYVFVITEGTAEGDGTLVRITRTGAPPQVETLADNLQTPRGIAAERGADERVTAIYFTTFTEGGTVERVTFTDGEPQHEVLANDLHHPYGITVDANFVYWTNWGDGTVMSLPKTAQPGTEPSVLAMGRVAPGAIAVTADTIYWVDEGSSSQPTGTLVKMPKPEP